MRARAAALVLLAAATVAAAPKAAAPGKKMTVSSFDCVLPASWYSEARPEGVTLRGPEVVGGVAPVISIRYVAPGKGEKDVGAYMARQTEKPDIEVEGWKTGRVEDVVVAGRKAKRVVHDTSEFVPPGSMETREVPMKDEHVAVPAAKGYYVLVFYSPRSLYNKDRPVFQKILESFKPKK